MQRSLVSLVLLIVISALCTDALAYRYTVQAILPLTGANSAQYMQWQSSAKLAAAHVNAAWAASSSPITSSDSLVVDFIDSKGDSVAAVHAVVSAMLNSSVTAVLTDAGEAGHAATILSSSSVPLVTPNADHSEFNTTGLGFYSMTPFDGASIMALQALCTKYDWTKMGVAYIQTDLGTQST